MATAFENFVNGEMPKRISIPVPGSGNLDPNKFLVSTGVGLGIQLTDPVGETGLQGITGFQGLTGIQGQTGYGVGSTGLIGPTGFQGPTGVQGYTGSGLQGITGLVGPTGFQGLTGLRGFTGLQGRTGVQGQTGLRGLTGLIGQTGSQGLTGVLGETGLQGTPGGITGYQGITGLQGPALFGYLTLSIDTPDSAETVPIFYTKDPIIIKGLHAAVRGTNPSVTIDPYWNSGLGVGDGTHFLTSPTAITDTNTGQDIVSFDSSSVPSNSWIVMNTSGKSGTVTNLITVFRYA